MAHRHSGRPAAWRAALILATAGPLACADDAVGPGPADPGDPVSVSLELVAQGLSSPLFVTAPTGDFNRLFVVERGGRIRIVRGGAVLGTPFLDVGPLITAGGEQGLLGMAFHPDFAANGRFYVNYTDTLGDTQIVRYQVSGDPDVADAASAFPILAIDQPYSNHNGGQLQFGPDGYLYVAGHDSEKFENYFIKKIEASIKERLKFMESLATVSGGRFSSAAQWILAHRFKASRMN